MIYKRSGLVGGSMCDTKLRLSPLAMLELIEDSASELLSALHIDGRTAMREYGAMWVFTKNTVSILRRPEWLEQFEIKSFISRHSPLRLFIDTELSSPEGEPLMRSRLEICALDLENGGIRKPGTLGFREDMEHPEPLPGTAFCRFRKEETEKLYSVTVRSTNLDFCGHTNNVEYLRFVLASFESRDLEQRGIRTIEMDYRGQSYEGDVLDIERSRQDNTDCFFITRNGQTAAACRIEWEHA